MTTVLDRYFVLLGSAGDTDPELDEWELVFAPDADVSYGGEVAIGEWIAPFHRHVLSRKRHSAYTCSTAVGADGVLTAEWHESGVDRWGGEYRAAGTAAARVDDSGRMTRLSVSFTEHTDRAWRIVRRHSEAWFEADPGRRAAKIKDAYAKDLTFVAGEVIQGHEALSEFSRKAQEAQPVVLARIGEVLQAHEYVLYEWHMVTPSGEEATGWETQRLDENELIDHIVLFTSRGRVFSPADQ